MRKIQHNNSMYLFNFDEDKADQTHFFSPEFWQEQQRIIGSAKGRGTTWFIHSTDILGVNVALRHYYRGGLWGKLNPDRYWFTSPENTRSFAEFILLDRLHNAGINVPKPLAARIEKIGFCQYRADILTEMVENAQDLTALLKYQQIPQAYWENIGKIIRQLHNLGICHSDLNAHNILLQHSEQKAKIWLLDFDKCDKKSGENWKTANLTRLKRSFLKEVERMKIQFNEENWEWLMRAYKANN